MVDKPRNLLQDPSAAVIANLFGFGVKPSSRGGFRITKPDDKKAVQFAEQVFGPTAFAGIGGLTQPISLTPSQELLTGGLDLGAVGLGFLPETLGAFTDVLLPSALEGALTGFRSDPTQLVEDALAQLREEAPFITGPFASDLGARATEAIARIQFAADEAAAGRRLQALPLGGLFATALPTLPTAIGGDILGFGQQARGVLETARPGFTQINLLRALQGGSPFAAIPTPSGTSRASQILGQINQAFGLLGLGAGAAGQIQSLGGGAGAGAGAGGAGAGGATGVGGGATGLSAAGGGAGFAGGAGGGGGAAGLGALFGCWAAAEFFGWFTPEWWSARRWILEGWQGPSADAFRRFYLRHGRALARLIRRDAEMRAKWRPFFEWAKESGA